MIRTLLRRLARMRMPAMVFAVMSLTGCAEAPAIIKDVASVVDTIATLYGSNGGNWLSLAADAAAPLADSSLKSELQAGVAQGRIDLLNAEQTVAQIVASKGAVTQQELDDAYKDFRATATIVAALADQLGLAGNALKPATSGAPQPASKSFPLPLALTNFKGSN